MSPEDILAERIGAALAEPRSRPLVVGLCGPQGSGKSTLANALVRRFARAATLSLDDLYKTRAERQAMARDVHPLFATRGVPGTHDVALGEAVLAAIDRGESVTLPRFDKGQDDRTAPADWPAVPEGLDLLVFEGWCVGAVPQPEVALDEPVNALERDEDRDGTWRRHVNLALRNYASLFARVDILVLLLPPSFDTVLNWRLEQEHALVATDGVRRGVMSDAQVKRFVAHFERISRFVLCEMPPRADIIITLDERRRALS